MSTYKTLSRWRIFAILNLYVTLADGSHRYFVKKWWRYEGIGYLPDSWAVLSLSSVVHMPSSRRCQRWNFDWIDFFDGCYFEFVCIEIIIDMSFGRVFDVLGPLDKNPEGLDKIISQEGKKGEKAKRKQRKKRKKKRMKLWFDLEQTNLPPSAFSILKEPTTGVVRLKVRVYTRNNTEFLFKGNFSPFGLNTPYKNMLKKMYVFIY